MLDVKGVRFLVDVIPIPHDVVVKNLILGDLMRLQQKQ